MYPRCAQLSGYSKKFGSLRDRDQQASADANRSIMPWPEVVLAAWFQIPAKSTLRGGPEHKIQHGFTGNGVARRPAFPRMNPLRANPEHELHFSGKGPGLLEQKVRAPLCRVMAESRRDACLQFQPVLYRRNFNRDGWAETPSTALEVPAWSRPKLDHSRGLLIHRLCERASTAQKKCDQRGLCRFHPSAKSATRSSR